MVSAWIEHVKKYASENGVSYRQAMKDSKATYVSQAKPKAPRKPRAPPKPKAPKGPPKPRGRPKKLTEREIQMAQGDTGAQLFEEAKNRMKAKQLERDLKKLEKKTKPSKKRKVKVIKYDEEAEWDENDPMNFMSAKEEQEIAPILPSPFIQPPTLIIPDPYIGKLESQRISALSGKLSAIKRKSSIPEKLKPDIYLEKSLRPLRAKQMKKQSMRLLELNKFKDTIKQLEDPILEKQKRHAVALSEAYTMGQEDRLSAQEREYIREKNKPTLDPIAEKEKKRLARYKMEADKILARQAREKEIERIYASYGVKSKPKHLQGLEDVLSQFTTPKSLKQIKLEKQAGEWSSEF